MTTYLTIFVAIVFWTGAICCGFTKLRGSKTTFYLWLGGAISFIVHIIAAFAEHYDWSHHKALAETARQTKEIFGWDSGIGLYFNYFFLCCLVIDIGLQFKTDTQHRFRKTVDILVIFMIINGAIIFGGTSAQVMGTTSLIFILVARYNGGRHQRSR